MPDIINKNNPLHTMKPLFAVILLTAFPLAAQAARPMIPGAGDILQQIEPLNLPAFSSSGTGLTIERADGAKLPPSAPFLVKSIQITGNTHTLFDTPTLHTLVADAEGKSLSLSQLGELAVRITSYYQSHGYPLTRAIIPAQTIAAGMVRIEIIEARYGQISLDNRSRVKDALLHQPDWAGPYFAAGFGHSGCRDKHNPEAG
jgi:hemolysin activation/secretion protein